ncbi:MAG TPA: OmpH family outer membrane protein [Luteolibacter sp.]|nr:OmpH family outer membrane protein [Luteolibacter sp.]
MTRALVLLIALATAVWSQSAAPRVAVVKVADIYRGLEATSRLDERVRREREEILADPRAAEVRRIIAELREMEERSRDPSAKSDEQTARRLERALDIKRREAWTLQREFENFREQRRREIDRAMVTEMRANLNLIAETARRTAQERGFDLLLDSSGETNTGVPFVLYQKNAIDLTDDVAAAIVSETASPPTD